MTLKNKSWIATRVGNGLFEKEFVSVLLEEDVKGFLRELKKELKGTDYVKMIEEKSGYEEAGK